MAPVRSLHRRVICLIGKAGSRAIRATGKCVARPQITPRCSGFAAIGISEGKPETDKSWASAASHTCITHSPAHPGTPHQSTRCAGRGEGVLVSTFPDPVGLDEARRDIQSGREWAESIYRKRRTDDVRNEFDAKDLFDCLGDDEDKLMALCEALLPCIYSNSGDSITEAVQAIVNPEIERRAAA